jgi:hypothetical protein
VGHELHTLPHALHSQNYLHLDVVQSLVAHVVQPQVGAERVQLGIVYASCDATHHSTQVLITQRLTALASVCKAAGMDLTLLTAVAALERYLCMQPVVLAATNLPMASCAAFAASCHQTLLQSSNIDDGVWLSIWIQLLVLLQLLLFLLLPLCNAPLQPARMH